MGLHGGWEPSGFAERLKVLRNDSGLSQATLAEKAGVSQSTVTKLERRIQEPAWPLVLALALALSVTPDAFLPDGGKPKRPKKRKGKAS